MRYGIMINLDYDSYPYDECRDIWNQVRNNMVEAGFRIEGRLFTIASPSAEACALARGVLDNINQDLTTGTDLYSYMKEFYGYDHTETINLLLPPSDGLEVQED
jgi:hypothetical protein